MDTDLVDTLSASKLGWTFPTLPPSIMDLITSNLHPAELCLLWETGCSALHRNMANGGVTTFELVLKVIGDRRWPVRISDFRQLRKLVITAPFGTGFHHIDLKSLPPSITHVHFEFNEAESCFYLRPDESSHIVASPDMVDISTIFPNLRSIILAGAYHVSNQFISSLPKSVHTVSVQTIDDVQPPGTPRFFSVEGLEALPPELGALSVQGYCPWVREDFLKLPRSLLSLNLLGSCPIEDDCFSALPPCLEKFELTGCNKMLVNSELLACLPTTLTSLKLRHVANLNRSCFQYLPKGLNSLELGGPLLNIDSESIKQFPPRLTFLNITDCSFESASCFHHFPKSLKTLIVNISRHLYGPQAAQIVGAQLPRSLTHLEIVNSARNHHPIGISCFIGLPSSIIILRVWPLQRSVELESQIASHLPPNLIDLDLRATMIPKADIPRLPRSITKLNLLHWVGVNAEDIANLPPKLESISILNSQSVDDDAISKLPLNLTQLELRNSYSLTDACIPLLPRTLKTLCLDGSHQLTGAITSHLPPGITHLSIASNPIVDTRAPEIRTHYAPTPAAREGGFWAFLRSYVPW